MRRWCCRRRCRTACLGQLPGLLKRPIPWPRSPTHGTRLKAARRPHRGGVQAPGSAPGSATTSEGWWTKVCNREYATAGATGSRARAVAGACIATSTTNAAPDVEWSDGNVRKPSNGRDRFRSAVPRVSTGAETPRAGGLIDHDGRHGRGHEPGDHSPGQVRTSDQPRTVPMTNSDTGQFLQFLHPKCPDYMLNQLKLLLIDQSRRTVQPTPPLQVM